MWWRQRREHDLDRELRDHLDLEAEEQPDRYAALRAFGNTGLIKESVRESWGWALLERLIQDLRYACRGIRQSPGFAIAAVLSLALGIGANTAIFGLIDAIRLRSLPVPKPQELARIQIRGGVKGWGISDSEYSLSTALFQQIHEHQQAFSGVFAWSIDNFPIGSGTQARMSHGLAVSGDFFEALGVPAAAGRLFTRDDDQPGCAAPGLVLSYGMWQSQFGGNSSALGSRLTILDHRFEVIGVAPASFTGLDVGERFEFALPLCAEALLEQGTESSSRRDVFGTSVMGRLKPGWSVSQASDHLRAISPGLMEATLPGGYAYGLDLYRQFRLEAVPAGNGNSELRNRYEAPLWLLLGITGLVLLISCANVANLLLARASARKREFAVRLALGASRARLLRQTLSECAVLAFLGAACGVALAQALSRAIVAFLSTEDDTVFLDLGVDWRVLAFTAVVAMSACFMFGVVPGLRSLRVQPGAALQSAGRATAGGHYRFSAQRWLVAGQVSLSLILLVGALLFVRSFRNLITVNPGFREKGILEANFGLTPLRLAPAAIKPFQRELLEEIRSIPGVETAATTSFRLLEGGSWSLIVRTKVTERDAKFVWVSPAYFATLEIPLLAGRDFNSNDREASPKIAIVNQTFARRFFANENPIGKTFRTLAEPNYPATEYQVVGIAKDSKYSSLREDAQAISYIPASLDANPVPWMTVYIRSSLPPTTVSGAVKKRIGEFHPQVIAQFSELQTQIRSGLTRERLMAAVSGFFGVLAVMLAAIGLYGVIAYLVTRRQSEIGIRMALGADRRRVITMVMRDVVVLVAIGVAIGTVAALALARTARTLLFGLTAHDPATFIAAGLALSVVAAIGSFLPARRASRVDPMVALRCE